MLFNHTKNPIGFQIFCIVLIFSLSFSSVFSATAHRSIKVLPSSNGKSYLSFNLEKGLVDVFQPHIVDLWDVGKTTQNLVHYLDAQIAVDGKSIRLSKLPITHASYINGTGIIRIEYELPRLHLIAYVWSPMIMEQKAAIMVVFVPAKQYYTILPNNIQFLTNAQSNELTSLRIKNVQAEGSWAGQVVLFTGATPEEKLGSLRNEFLRAKPNLLLEAEERWWDHWHRQVTIPSNIYEKKYHLLKQSAAFIKMAQCREPGPSYGQIVNSLSPNHEKKSVVRDMAYAIVALSRLGYVFEARDALKFLLNSRASRFESMHINGKQFGMGRPYAISLSHYDGLGYERADFVGGYPRLYLDGQGLFLWAFAEYMKRTTDFKTTRAYWQQVTEFIIGPLIHSITDEGLVRPDCGWWQTNAPGEHFTFTNLAAYKGLNSASMVAHMLGLESTSDKYIKVAADLRANILTKLTVGKSLMMARSLETKKFPYFLDGSSVEAVNWRIVDPYWKTANTISQSLNAFFQVNDSTRGFCLGYVSDKDKMPESPFVTLRAYAALNKLKEKKRAQDVLEWITEQAVRNAEIIPEFFNVTTADYEGAYPMIGLGAAPYIMALLPD
jgi:GH15 family glucan-1,4-alpha-glucosidase